MEKGKGGAISHEVYTREVHYSEPIRSGSDSDSLPIQGDLFSNPLFWISVLAIGWSLSTHDWGQNQPVIINNQAPPPIIINNN